MDLIHMKYILKTANLQHVTKAAEELNMTQSALSKAISRFEEEIGILLFDRQGKHVRLNANGEAVLPQIRQILSEAEALENQIADLRGGTFSEVTFASSLPAGEPNWLQEYMQDFLNDNPNVRINCIPMNRAQLIEALKNNDVDFVIWSGVSSFAIPGVQWTKLFNDRVGIVMSHHNPLATREKIYVSDLAHENFLCNEVNSDVFDLTQTFCQIAGFEPHVFFQGNFPLLIGKLVCQNKGITFITNENHVANNTRNGKDNWEDNLVFHDLEDSYCMRYCGLGMPQRGYQVKAVQNFCAGLLERASLIYKHNDYPIVYG